MITIGVLFFAFWVQEPVVPAAVVQKPEPTIHAELAGRTAFLGDPVELKIRIAYEGAWRFERVTVPEKLGEGAALQQNWSEPERAKDIDLTWQTLTVRIAWYRLGEKKVPPITLRATAPNGETKTFATPELAIEILGQLTEDDQELAGGKDQVSLEPDALWPYIVAGVVLVLIVLGLALYFLSKRKKDEVEKKIPLPPPYDEAMARLRDLTHGSLLKEGKYKAFHVAINQIVRHYYGRLFKINAEEMTSFELEEWFAERSDLPEGLVAVNREFQEVCDRVKFAKHDPMESENKQVVNWAYQIVENLKPEQEEAAHVAIG